jgi:excisionase family DNA binding protein
MNTPHPLNDQERALALQLGSLLENQQITSAELTISGHEPLVLSRIALELLEQVLLGNEVALTPPDKELTTQQAADILNVSRPFVVKLLKNKQLPYKKIGSHRRLHLRDVLTYKNKMWQESEEAMQALADQAQELKLGY